MRKMKRQRNEVDRDGLFPPPFPPSDQPRLSPQRRGFVSFYPSKHLSTRTPRPLTKRTKQPSQHQFRFRRQGHFMWPRPLSSYDRSYGASNSKWSDKNFSGAGSHGFTQ